MNQTSCSCGDDCPTCDECKAPICECFCDLYDEYGDVEEDEEEEDDDGDDDTYHEDDY